MTEESQQSTAPPETPKTALYASDEDPIVLRPHVYDGIQEYDQRLPNWWLFTFYIMIVFFAIFWAAYYQFDFFRSPQERIDAIMAEVNDKKRAELEALLADLDDKTLVTDWATNPTVLASAESNYNTHCLACHGEDLSAAREGFPLPGLPLNDAVWKFGGRPIEIFNLIRNGSPPESEGHNNLKMEPWGAKLSSASIAELTAYIISKNKEEFAPFAE